MYKWQKKIILGIVANQKREGMHTDRESAF